MSSESGLTCDEILEYLLQHDGRVRNKEFVTHFKHYLTGSPAQEEARLKFKEFVNYLATTKKEDDVKYVILRKKFFPNTVPDTPSSSSLSSLSEPTVPLSESTVSLSPRAPPPYRPPPPVTSPTPSVDSMISRDEFSFDNVSQCSISSDVGSLKDQHDAPPQAPPRRRTLEKLKIENKENISNEMPAPSEAGEKESTDSEIVSVKERMQKFNRMAETDLKSSSSQSNLRKRHEKGADDDDGVSVTSMDTKTRDWIIRSSLSDYQVLAKLATENPRLVRFKDPITGYTALHWAAKHGNEDVIKLIAGTHGANVNVRTNGGYTPLHLAAQFGHENLYDLLVKVYKADQNIRDWSGKKAYSYLQTTNKSVSAETFRKIKARRKQSEKDLGFLRIGSLNVRVKKTTEAFSNFLGYGGGGGPNNTGEKIHKSWGSADNLPQKIMPPPKTTQIKKRKSKRGQDFQAISHSTPSTPNQIRAHNKHPDSRGDSDSDSACGFDTNWQTKLE